MIEPPEGPISKNKICCTTVLWCASMDLDQLKENTVITLSWDLIQPRCGDSHSLECNLHSQAHRTRVSGSNDQGHKPFPFVDLCVDRLFFSSVSQVWFLPKGLGKSAIVQIPRWINSTAMFALDHGHLKLAIESETLCSEYLATIPTMWIHMWQCVRMYIWFSVGPPCKWGWVFCLAYGSPPMACGGGVFGMLVMRGQFCFLWFSPPVACGGGVSDVCNVM